MSFQLRFVLARQRRGLSQIALAGKTGLSTMAVSNIETGRTRNPQFSTKVELARALDVPLEWLLTGHWPSSVERPAWAVDEPYVEPKPSISDRFRLALKMRKFKNAVTFSAVSKMCRQTCVELYNGFTTRPRMQTLIPFASNLKVPVLWLRDGVWPLNEGPQPDWSTEDQVIEFNRNKEYLLDDDKDPGPPADWMPLGEF